MVPSIATHPHTMSFPLGFRPRVFLAIVIAVSVGVRLISLNTEIESKNRSYLSLPSFWFSPKGLGISELKSSSDAGPKLVLFAFACLGFDQTHGARSTREG